MTNQQVDAWNDHISEMRARLMRSSARTYYAHNEVQGDGETSAFAADLNDSMFLQDVTENGIPPSKLTLRSGDIAFITRTVNKKAGLITNKRVVIIGLGEKIVKVKLLGGEGRGRVVEVPRVKHEFSPGQSALDISRTQFPIRLAYAISYNKAQGTGFISCHGECVLRTQPTHTYARLPYRTNSVTRACGCNGSFIHAWAHLRSYKQDADEEGFPHVA